jgi:small subunit ribosomal protein S20
LANTRSAEKRNRQAQKRRARNMGVRTRVKGALKKVRDAIAKGDGSAKQALVEAASTLNRAASKGVVHRNAAARRISRLAKAVTRSAAPQA